jgi:hypothetical protein
MKIKNNLKKSEWKFSCEIKKEIFITGSKKINKKKILVATDNHLGFNEKDPIRKK